MHCLYLIFISLFIGYSPLIQANSSIEPSTQEKTIEVQPVTNASLLHEEHSVQPGRSFWVVVKVQLDEGWHIYWKNPGDSGLATEIEWKLPEGFQVQNIHWPTPQQFSVDGIVGYGYSGEVLLLAEINPSATMNGESIEFNATIHWLACSDTACIPGKTTIQHTLPWTTQGTTPNPIAEHQSYFSKARGSLPLPTTDARAEILDQQIQLHVNLPADTDLNNIYFFPYEDGVINPSSIKAQVEQSGNQSHQITFQRGNERSVDSLKGVIAMVNPIDHSIISSLDLNVPFVSGEAGAEVPLGLLGAIFFAFVGGLILNLMPCVLPVISIKILSFVKMSGEKRSLVMRHGMAFCFGVLLCFWVLAAALLLIQAYGQSVGWGFQLQNSGFVAFLAVILFLMGLSLFGVFEVGSLGSIMGRKKAKSNGLIASFGNGILATLVATPCTGPFLGASMGYGLTAGPAGAFMVFTSMGLGLAIPYLLFAAFPALLAYLPKPGHWMDLFKQFMGFPLLLTVIWLLWVFQAQTSGMAAILLLIGLWVLGIGCWLYGKRDLVGDSKQWVKYFYAAVVALIMGGGSLLVVNATSEQLIAVESSTAGGEHSDWEPYSLSRIEELRAAGTPVFVDFTARWCLICQANHVVLNSSVVADAMKKKGIVRMKADWTKNDPVITEQLKLYGRGGVPLYLYYGPDASKKPKILPQVLTADIVIQEIAN